MAWNPSRTFPSLLLAAWAPFLAAESRLVIIANPDTSLTQLTQDEARNVFLGRQKRLPSGLPAQPVEQGAPTEVRERFYRLLAHKDLAEINAYWARLYFTGQAHPPRQERDAEEVIRTVAANKGAIGLVEWDKADRRVKVVLVLDVQ
jgi:ABC-type phosphate transport system substrate-binding protein